MKRQVPRMTTDAEAEAFLESDLSDLDFSQFKPTRFQFTDKAARQGKGIPTPTSLVSRPRANEKSRKRGK
jgi:predicted DNA binding CopG/RHH family protein